jgi:hypothetical protein
MLRFVTLIALSSFAMAAEYPADNGPMSKDEDLLREWIESKRTEPLSEKKAQLSISGEVRTMMRASAARRQNNTTQQRIYLYGPDQGYPPYNWINRASLYFDYSAHLAWAHAKLKFENEMGGLGGSTDNVTLEEGYLGYRVLTDGKSLFDLFIGRTKLYTLFDSQVQFNALLDGLIMRYDNEYGKLAHLHFAWAGSLINSFTDHYGWVGQLSLTDLFQTGLYLRFSFTDWQKKSPTIVYRGNGEPVTDASGKLRTTYNNPQFAFHIAQYLIGYNYTGRLPFKLYAAALINHAANRQPQIGFNRHQSIAYYFGLNVGHIQKAGDMAINIVYQYVGAQAVPGWDMAGIGLGNPGGSTFYYPSLTADPAPFGNTNFKGLEMNYLIGLSPNLACLTKFQISRSAVSINEWASHYKHFELSAIYAF